MKKMFSTHIPYSIQVSSVCVAIFSLSCIFRRFTSGKILAQIWEKFEIV